MRVCRRIARKNGRNRLGIKRLIATLACLPSTRFLRQCLNVLRSLVISYRLKPAQAIARKTSLERSSMCRAQSTYQGASNTAARQRIYLDVLCNGGFRRAPRLLDINFTGVSNGEYNLTRTRGLSMPARANGVSDPDSAFEGLPRRGYLRSCPPESQIRKAQNERRHTPPTPGLRCQRIYQALHVDELIVTLARRVL